MSRRRWEASRFDRCDEDPSGPLVNLVDLMLVFVCGLIAALAASEGAFEEQVKAGGTTVNRGNELPRLPPGAGQAGSGFEPVGQVFRHPQTGKLILISDDQQRTTAE